jgi:diguanylate cyclase (GGDEF)-like protein
MDDKIQSELWEQNWNRRVGRPYVRFLKEHPEMLQSESFKDLIKSVELYKSDVLQELDKLEAHSLEDALTGLPNRRAYRREMVREIERSIRRRYPFSLICADGDGFGDINNNFGHQAGDHYLIETADLLRKSTRKGVDIVCRYGGDEFFVILTETEKPKALEVAQRIKENFASAKPTYGERMSISQGLVSFSPARYSQMADPEMLGDAYEVVTKRADEAMYKAKDAYHKALEESKKGGKPLPEGAKGGYIHVGED